MTKWARTAAVTAKTATMSASTTPATTTVAATTRRTPTTTVATATAVATKFSQLVGSSTNLLLTTLIIAALAQTTIGFRSIALNSGEGRKLFGGYRITPKHCRATKTLPITDPRANGPTICMFNHECAQRNGEVVGACMDGFLFGACCQIPHSQELESTLINDAQKIYYQQHQQQKLQQAISNPAAAQSYETYGESMQQQSQESNKYHDSHTQETSGSTYHTTQPDIYEQDNLDKVYQQLGSSSRPSNYKPSTAVTGSTSTLQQSSNSYTQQQHEQTHAPASNSGNYAADEIESSSTYQETQSVPNVNVHNTQVQADHVSEQQEVQSSFSQQSPQDVSNASTDVSTQSGSSELESDTNIQGNPDVGNTNTLADNPPPAIHVHKDSVKISSPSSSPHNDDFVLQVLSTLKPEHLTDRITFSTEVPMKIASNLIDQTSSESNSFEEVPAITPHPLRLNAKPSQPVNTHKQEHNGQKLQEQHKPKPQNIKQQDQHHQHQHQNQQHTHNHNQLILDGGQFTHSDITHPAAEADLLEDLQFSTGYGPQPVYVDSPHQRPSASNYGSSGSTTKIPPSEDKYVLVQTLTNDQLNKQPSPAGNPTTISSITTHVDSIESIILQLNNTNHGPAYNVVKQQQASSYGTDTTSSINSADNSYDQQNDYESTSTVASTTIRPQSASPTNPSGNYFYETETKRPDNIYAQNSELDQQKYPSAEAQVAAYLDSATNPRPSSDEKDQLSNSYMQNGYPASKPESSESSPSQNYGDETALVLDEHTMPDKNYNDASGTGHQTSEFNKMPAVGIAYPVDMSYLEEEGNLAVEDEEQSGYGVQSSTTAFQKPPESIASNTYQTITSQTEQHIVPTYTKQTTVSGAENQNHNHPIASYIGVVTSQNYNQQQQPESVYSQVPPEVSVSSHTTKIEENYASSSSYPTPQPEKHTTISYDNDNSSTYATRPSSSSRPSTNSYISSSSNGLSSTQRPQLVTASSTKPRPKPSTKRPTRKPVSNTTKNTSNKSPSKRPAQPTNSYDHQAQPSNNYHTHQTDTKNPAQPSNTYNDPPIYTKKPATQPHQSGTKNPAQPLNTYNDPPIYTKKPATQPIQIYNTEPTYTKRPSSQPAQKKRTTTKPSKTTSSQTSNNYNGAPVNVKSPPPISTYSQDESTVNNGQQVVATNNQNTNAPAQQIASYNHGNAQPLSTHGQNSKRPSQPSASYGQDTLAPVQPVEAYQQNNQGSTQASYPNNDEYHPAASSPSKSPVSTKLPHGRPVSTSYVTGPTSPRPPTTFGYHDGEVPPLIIADDKLDAFVHSTAQTVATGPTQPTYQAPLYIGGVTPLVVDRPQQSNSNLYKKPGFVKVQPSIRPPVPTVLITPKPTVINLVTSTSWTQVPNGGTSINDNAYPPTTPIPGYGSTSYIFSPLVTRRPEIASNTPEYVSMSAITSNDFDDAGYYGAQGIQGGQNAQGSLDGVVHPAFTQASTEATYAVPSDDRPAFPGYYGPTPSYPAFQVPGEKVSAQIEEGTFTSQNDFVNFPPVRNPNLNMSAASSAVTTDLELSTPAFVEDGVLKDKMNTLVHKIVESLQGNFDALADMIDDANNTAGSTYNSNALQSTVGNTIVTNKPTRKPTRITTTKPKRPTTKKPSVTRVSTKAPARKPSTVTTRKPVSRPRPATTTKKPTTRRPTKRTTTTTVSSADDEIVDEEDEEDVNPTDNEIGQTETLSSIGASGRKFKCGVRPHVKSGRIVGGKGSTFGAYPWQVLVRESTWLGLFTKNKCGGVLISNRFIITAAHCQPGFLGSLVAVMGEYDISGDLESKRSVTKNVKRVIVHRQYDPATFENDLALLELDSSVQFDSHIVPICMPSDVADFTGRMATVTGWGRLKYAGGVPSILQEVQVPIIENSVCQEMFHTAGHNKKILTSFLCAGYANGQKDSCEGDSGGPLVLQRPDGRYELAGTVSHGIKCAAPYLPGVYMRTTFYKPWLRSITGVK